LYVLYLDESGASGSEASYFVLAGLAAFEREIHFFSQDLDQVQARYFPSENAPICFHATKLHPRPSDQLEAPWNQLTVEQRREIKTRFGEIISSHRGVLFGCAIERKYAELRGRDPYEHAFEDVVSRFDLFLSRQNRISPGNRTEEQRGLVVLAQSGFQKTLTILAQRFQRSGTRWGQLHNMADIPYFAPAQDTRMLQLADFIANAIYGRYHAGITIDFDRIAQKFDTEDNLVHGLVHLTLNPSCSCLACFSRKGR
jgi:hypothetical protein